MTLGQGTQIDMEGGQIGHDIELAYGNPHISCPLSFLSNFGTVIISAFGTCAHQYTYGMLLRSISVRNVMDIF